MKNKFATPRINYIVFELVRVNVNDYLNSEYYAESLETVYFAVMPEIISYRLMSRDSIQKTQNKTFITKFDYAPEKCTISGHFGVQHRFIAGTYMDGWDRLKQFYDDIIVRAKKDKLPDADGNRYLYAVNYYDFSWQKFGQIDIQGFTMNGNARENTKLPRYSCDFVIVGNLLIAKSEDVFLKYLNDIYGKAGVIAQAYLQVNKLLSNNILNTVTQIGAVGLDLVNIAETVQNSLQSISNGSNSGYQIVGSLF